jgi:hypothetical protein
MANRQAKIEEAKLQLEESKIVSQTINAATSKIRKDRLLAADGSNFAQWTRDLQELGRTYLNSAEFFEKTNHNSVLEKIGRAIFLARLHPSLIYDAQGVLTCSELYTFVEKKFKTVSQAAQMNVWHKFMNFKLSDHPSSAGLASKLRDLESKWKTLKVSMDEDTFLGFILQGSLDQNTAMTHEFKQHVKVAVQDHPQNLAPNFDKLIHLVELC